MTVMSDRRAARALRRLGRPRSATPTYQHAHKIMRQTMGPALQCEHDVVEGYVDRLSVSSERARALARDIIDLTWHGRIT